MNIRFPSQSFALKDKKYIGNDACYEDSIAQKYF